jgi:hypothetical protein
MVAFANHNAGYIIFGVEAKPHKIVGINPNSFLSRDPADITNFLKKTLSYEVEWERNIIEIFSKVLGYIYTNEAIEKPVVAIQNSSSEIKSGSIYYRYSGQTSIIRYNELNRMIENRILNERKMWMERIIINAKLMAKSGPENINILDPVSKKLYGKGAPILIDEKLLKSLNIIKKGQFKKGGLPTLEIVGDIQSIHSAKDSKPISIYSDDLIMIFLEQEKLTSEYAKEYLKAVTYQTTHYLPLFYFIFLSKFSKQEAITYIKSTKSTRNDIKTKIADKILGKLKILPIGRISNTKYKHETFQPDIFAQEFKKAEATEKRNLLRRALLRNKECVIKNFNEISLHTLYESLTHLNKNDFKVRKDTIIEILLALFEKNEGLAKMQAFERTSFRKAVALCDENLYGDL